MNVNGYQTHITCDAPIDRNQRACGGTAEYETDNPAQRHAFYRCTRPGCKNLMVVCANPGHRTA